jgi:carbonic anhydrase
MKNQKTHCPKVALRELKEGNIRFVSERPMSLSTTTDSRRLQLIQGQSPHTVVLSCSDSRLPPEHVFDQGLGTIFAIRVAGNVLNEEAVASIEYAVAHLGSRLIVVMGHESCGAVKAALHTPADQCAGSPSLNKLVRKIRSNIGKVSSLCPVLREPVIKNASATAKELMKQSKIIRDAVKSGAVHVQEAIYKLDTGRVEFH